MNYNLEKQLTLKNFVLLLILSVVATWLYLTYIKKDSKMEEAITESYGNFKKMIMGSKENLENTLAEDTLSGEPAVDLEKPNELLPVDLLPNYKEATSFSAGNAVTDLLKSQNFIIGSFPQGLDTVATSKRIPYFDIRNNYPVPKEEYPWNNSPYDEAPGSGRRFFDIA